MNFKQQKLVIIITGATGVGKTDLSLVLADKIPSEIVNIDMGQFYKPLTIGTAKPNLKDQTIPHHLFDIINEPRDFTAYEFNQILLKKLNEIWDKNKLPIIVGGSGFYIQNLFFPISNQSITINKNKKINLNDNLWEKLYSIDPQRAEKINKNDLYRISRALDIWQTTGKKPSQYLPIYQPAFKYIFVNATRERQELYNRINIRTVEMINNGWINEVKNLSDDWKDFLRIKKIIGYNEIILFLESYYNNDQNLLINDIQKKSRNYAKRQITFFNTLIKKITSAEKQKNSYNENKIIICDLSFKNYDFCIKEILESL